MDQHIIIIAVVILALSFDFINGFHDTANSIATAISTKALKPAYAIMLAASMNLLGALVFTGVAKTVGGKVANPANIEHGVYVVATALVAAIIWNLFTWYYGIPSSSSHALIGSLAGAVIAAAGISAVNLAGFLSIIESLILSPLLAFTVGYIIMSIIRVIFANFSPHKINTKFRSLQILTAAFQSFSHGTNDAQKTMGIITFALVAGGYQSSVEIQTWVKVSAAVAMALGTSVGGWRIIKTIGTKIIKFEPASGFAADLSSALVIISATLIQLPVSTTHVISSAIMGVGSAKRFSSVQWGTAITMVSAWVITLPVTMVLAGFTFLIVKFLFL
ncbi:inorganic phosphate transporter [Desulforamulus aeronauticus]|uniref:Inorganic phosphate transporter, PiT family n=1 Tax=Desulforamulus aeronauticus DSM 10349 TaxID=1121421 RepID=A0A1M6U0E1_9FIRM|nr:inorganic phosphate transporter [Desulforamulus aeronauticus]SHK62676.1 inorganic phosphate transporter, PiT family [Desulforamulus aeronauticus DSM 10349]